MLYWAKARGLRAAAYDPDLERMIAYRPQDSTFVVTRNGDADAQIGDPIAALSGPPHKVVLMTDSRSENAAVIAGLQRQIGDRARVLASSPTIIEVIIPGVSKAQAMSWVAERLGVGREETMAIGDGDNDVEILEWAALGVAMGNGSAAAKAAADWIAPSVEEDGLAAALHRFILDS